MSRAVPTLPPQFAKLAALYRSSTYEPERDTARRKAEAILPPEAGGFERALRIQAYHDARERAGAMNFMAGFDEFTEIDNPGHMARQAADRAEKRRKQDARRAELVAEFGSLDAVLKPCAREKALLAAVKPWRVAQARPHQRWTATLAGLDTYDWRQAPAEVTAAIEGAIPLPATYASAIAEAEFWQRRNDDMELAARDVFRGDHMLDMPALWRWWIVEALAEHKIELRTVGEVAARMRAYRWSEAGENTDIEDAIIRDLEAMAAGVGDKVGMPEVCRNAPIFNVMAERLRLGVGAVSAGFMYRNESEDVLAYTLTGMKSGPERNVALAAMLGRLESTTAREGFS